MRENTRTWIVGGLFVAGFALGGLLDAPVSSAYMTRIHASECVEYGMGGDELFYNHNGAESRGAGSLFCPIPSTTTLGAPAVTRVEIDGHDASTTAYVAASACITFHDANGGICDTAVTNGVNSVTGWYRLVLDSGELDEWVDWADYAYLHVEPGASFSTVRGYYISN